MCVNDFSVLSCSWCALNVYAKTDTPLPPPQFHKNEFCNNNLTLQHKTFLLQEANLVFIYVHDARLIYTQKLICPSPHHFQTDMHTTIFTNEFFGNQTLQHKTYIHQEASLVFVQVHDIYVQYIREDGHAPSPSIFRNDYCKSNTLQHITFFLQQASCVRSCSWCAFSICAETDIHTLGCQSSICSCSWSAFNIYQRKDGHAPSHTIFTIKFCKT